MQYNTWKQLQDRLSPPEYTKAVPGDSEPANQTPYSETGKIRYPSQKIYPTYFTP
jgi:hypothetical protein